MNHARILGKALSPLLHASGLYARRWRSIAGERGSAAIVVCYHRILADELCAGREVLPEEGIPASVFEAQIRFLLSSFEPCESPQVCTGARDGRMRFAITFDDGYEDNFAVAAPILKGLGVPATFFVVAGHVGTTKRFWWDRVMDLVMRATADSLDVEAILDEAPAAGATRMPLGDARSRLRAVTALAGRMRRGSPERIEPALGRLADATGAGPASEAGIPLMTWEQLRRLRDDGFEIGAHTVSHRSLARLDDAEVASEIAICREILEQRLESPVRALAYPYGSAEDFDERATAAATRAGYTAAFSLIPGIVTPDTDPARIPRICLNRSWAFANAFAVDKAFAA